jgi:hypothetical protein
LENHWNGTLLTSIDTVLSWAKTMTWRAVAPIVHLLDRVYETGVRLTPAPNPSPPGQTITLLPEPLIEPKPGSYFL